MGKKANERRKRIFQELKENGQLDRPIDKVNKQLFSIRAAAKGAVKRSKKERRDPKLQCCKILFAHKMPENFRPCATCPLNEAEESAKL